MASSILKPTAIAIYSNGLNATYHSIDAAVWAAKGQPGLVEVHIPAMNMHFLAAELELLEGVIA